MKNGPNHRQYRCPSCGTEMLVGHVWVNCVGQSASASLCWASGTEAPKRDLLGRPSEEDLLAFDRWLQGNTRSANLCKMCGFVAIDLKLNWERCLKCNRMIQPLKRACDCGCSTLSPDPQTPEEFADCEDAFATASKLDQSGDWDAAISFYQILAKKWPEHCDYITGCLKAIKEKQATK